MDERTAFKHGFLARCVEDGPDIEAARQRVKQALDARFQEKSAAGAAAGGAAAGLTGLATGVGRPLWNTLLGYGVPFALAAPPVAGGLTGYAAAKATDADDVDAEEIKKRELIDEYRRQTERLRRLQKLRERKGAKKQRDRVFL